MTEEHPSGLLVELSEDVANLRRKLQALRESVERSRVRLPAGRFDPESGAPLDIPAAFRSLYELLMDETLPELEGHLDRAEEWLEGGSLPGEVGEDGRGWLH